VAWNHVGGDVDGGGSRDGGFVWKGLREDIDCLEYTWRQCRQYGTMLEVM
jgi:hypothetical protein